MDPLAAGLQALSIFKGGAQSPTVTSGGAGTFANQTLNFGDGLPEWNMHVGGSGQPPEFQAFSGNSQPLTFGQSGMPPVFNTTPRADSLVMGLTGLSTTSAKAAGNGISVGQTPTSTSYMTLALVASVAFIAAYILKK